LSLLTRCQRRTQDDTGDRRIAGWPTASHNRPRGNAVPPGSGTIVTINLAPDTAVTPRLAGYRHGR
jgi:hypothetical protein